MMIYKGRKITAVRGGSMDTNYKPRYILVDEATSEIVDDAQGYGYKDARKAYSAFCYKHRDKTKDGEKRRIKKLVIKFCKDNPELIEDLLDLEFHILKMNDKNITLNSKIVSDYFKNRGIENLDFSVEDFLKYWDAE